MNKITIKPVESEELKVNVKTVPLNPVQIIGETTFSAYHSKVWAEGSDEEVAKLGGEHSSKGWAGKAKEIEEQIEGDISDLRADVEQVKIDIAQEAINREQADTELGNTITALDTKVDGINANLTQQITELESDVDGKYEELTRDIDDLADVVEEDFTQVNNRITEVSSELEQTIEENVVALQNEDSRLQNQINAHSSTLTEHDTRITNNANAITQEIADRQNADDTLQEQIDNLKARGRYLSLWNATTGLAETNPETSPYDYKAGDYFIVGTVGETNYKPVGTQYIIGQASTEIETEELATEDVYYFDGSVWHLQVNHGKTVSFANLAGQPSDNTALKNALDSKQPIGDYATKTELSTGLAEKQDTLISGTSIKTINNTSILGSGNIEIQCGGTWGTITGDITAQTDLQNALDTKANDSDVVHKAQAETVTGVKTFTGGKISAVGQPSIAASNGVMVGSYTATGWADVSCHRLCDNKINTGSYYVNSDGSVIFRHKTGTATDEGNANDAIFTFHPVNGIKAGFGGAAGVTAVANDVLIDTVNYSKLDTTNKDVLGSINELNSTKQENLDIILLEGATINA